MICKFYATLAMGNFWQFCHINLIIQDFHLHFFRFPRILEMIFAQNYQFPPTFVGFCAPQKTANQHVSQLRAFPKNAEPLSRISFSTRSSSAVMVLSWCFLDVECKTQTSHLSNEKWAPFWCFLGYSWGWNLTTQLCWDYKKPLQKAIYSRENERISPENHWLEDIFPIEQSSLFREHVMFVFRGVIP